MNYTFPSSCYKSNLNFLFLFYKPSCGGLTFNRSKRRSCSAIYRTHPEQVRNNINVQCMLGKKAAPFLAEPCAPFHARRGAPHRTPSHSSQLGAHVAAGDQLWEGNGGWRSCLAFCLGFREVSQSHRWLTGSFASPYSKCPNWQFQLNVNQHGSPKNTWFIYLKYRHIQAAMETFNKTKN